MSDGSIWSIPVEIIAYDRALRYAHEFDDNIQRSLKEDTYPLFESDHFEIKDWAQNNMNWSDVSIHAVLISPSNIDFQDDWINGHIEIHP